MTAHTLPFNWQGLQPAFSLSPSSKAIPNISIQSNNRPPNPQRQSSARWGPSAPVGYPGHYGRELGLQGDVPPGLAEHHEINTIFFRPEAASTNMLKNHFMAPPDCAKPVKQALPPPLPVTQPQLSEAPEKEKGFHCCQLM